MDMLIRNIVMVHKEDTHSMDIIHTAAQARLRLVGVDADEECPQIRTACSLTWHGMLSFFLTSGSCLLSLNSWHFLYCVNMPHISLNTALPREKSRKRLRLSLLVAKDGEN